MLLFSIHRENAVENELGRTIGIMDIAGSMINVEKLVGLRDSTKKRVVAAGTFLVFVESNSGAFGMTFCRLYRTIKIQGNSGKPFSDKGLYNQRAGHASNVIHALVIHFSKGAGYGGNIWQLAQSHRSENQRLVAIIIVLAQTSEAEYKVNEKKQHHKVAAENLRNP